MKKTTGQSPNTALAIGLSCISVLSAPSCFLAPDEAQDIRSDTEDETVESPITVHPSRQSPEASGILEAREPSIVAYSPSLQPVLMTETYRQLIAYGWYYDGADPTKLVIREEVWNNGQWNRTENEFAASFVIDQIVSNKKNHFYVLGTGPNGDRVIERWKRSKIGMPGQPVTYVLGRTELYRGTSLGDIGTIGIDIQQRYLMIVHDSPGKLSQMMLPAGSPIQEIYDSAQIPGLSTLGLVQAMMARYHSTEGLIWILETFGHQDGSVPYSPRTLIYDANDDGTMDSWLSPLDTEGWETLGYHLDVWLGHPNIKDL